MKNTAIDTILFTVKNKEEEIADVMPVNKTKTLPIKMNAAMGTYFMNEESYNTDGPIDGNLAKLHKVIEHLIGKSFGSYDFYQ